MPQLIRQQATIRPRNPCSCNSSNRRRGHATSDTRPMVVLIGPAHTSLSGICREMRHGPWIHGCASNDTCTTCHQLATAGFGPISVNLRVKDRGIARVAKKLGTARLRMSERSGSLGVDCHQKCNGIISNKLGAVSRQHKIVGFSVLGRALVTFCVVALRGIRTPFSH